MSKNCLKINADILFWLNYGKFMTSKSPTNSIWFANKQIMNFALCIQLCHLIKDFKPPCMQNKNKKEKIHMIYSDFGLISVHVYSHVIWLVYIWSSLLHMGVKIPWSYCFLWLRFYITFIQHYKTSTHKAYKTQLI